MTPTMLLSMSHTDLLDVVGVIRRVRRLADLSQRDLAVALGVAPSTVARWETGESEPNVSQFQRMLGLAELDLIVTDHSGNPVRPMRSDAPRDKQFRQRPAHLDVVDDVDWLTGQPTIKSPGRRERDRRRVHPVVSQRVGVGVQHDHPTMGDILDERGARREQRGARLRELRRGHVPERPQ